MACAIESSGTQTCVISTEHTLATPATAHTRVLQLDLNAAAIGDTFEIRLKTKVLSGGTIRVARRANVVHSQDGPIVESVPVAMPNGGEFSIRQTAGTGRSVPWAVVTLD